MIAIACDHGGYILKDEVMRYLDEIGAEYMFLGTYDEERTDYPIYAKKVAEKVSSGQCEKGILICRSGHGMEIAANKYKGVRAANIINEEDAKFAKSDDDVNVITLSGDQLDKKEIARIIRAWLGTEFKGGRYGERLKMVEEIESNNMK